LLEALLAPLLFDAGKSGVTADDSPATIAPEARCRKIDALQRTHSLRIAGAPKA
jgi:hypothetical protein